MDRIILIFTFLGLLTGGTSDISTYILLKPGSEPFISTPKYQLFNVDLWSLPLGSYELLLTTYSSFYDTITAAKSALSPAFDIYVSPN
jgi:hypothetical protein